MLGCNFADSIWLMLVVSLIHNRHTWTCFAFAPCAAPLKKCDSQFGEKALFSTQNSTQKHCVDKAPSTSSTTCSVAEYTSLKIESREYVQMCLASLLLELVAERKGSFARWSMRAIWQIEYNSIVVQWLSILGVLSTIAYMIYV